MRTLRGWVTGVVVVSVVLGLVGCAPVEQAATDLQAQAEQKAADLKQQATDQVRMAVDGAIREATTQARRITADSSAAAIAAARQELLTAQQKLKQLPSLSEVQANSMAQVQAELRKLDTAAALQSARAEVDRAVTEARDGGVKLSGDLAIARRTLREQDPTFRAVDDRLIEAERAFAEASRRVREMVTPPASARERP